MKEIEIAEIVGLTAAVSRATQGLSWQAVMHIVMNLRLDSRGIGRLNTWAKQAGLSMEEERSLDRLYASVMRSVRQIPGARVEISVDPVECAVRLRLPDGSGSAVGGGWLV
jgi:hypothetical protein